MLKIQRYILTGILTVIPIWITWLVFEFFFTTLSQFGQPLADAFSTTLQSINPTLAEAVITPTFQSLIAIVLTLLALFLLGWIVSQVIGKRIMHVFDNVMNRIPVVQTIYGSVRKLIHVLQNKPEGLQRVVLINFPNPEMHTVGFVTQTFIDPKTRKELAAVYVPTTPNPTSGYMEIVPSENLTPTEWTMDEAMTFILSAGAVAPEKMPSIQK